MLVILATEKKRFSLSAKLHRVAVGRDDFAARVDKAEVRVPNQVRTTSIRLRNAEEALHGPDRAFDLHAHLPELVAHTAVEQHA